MKNVVGMHALLLNTIFLCSKFEILMVLKLGPGQNVDDEEEVEE